MGEWVNNDMLYTNTVQSNVPQDMPKRLRGSKACHPQTTLPAKLCRLPLGARVLVLVPEGLLRVPQLGEHVVDVDAGLLAFQQTPPLEHRLSQCRQ